MKTLPVSQSSIVRKGGRFHSVAALGGNARPDKGSVSQTGSACHETTSCLFSSAQDRFCDNKLWFWLRAMTLVLVLCVARFLYDHGPRVDLVIDMELMAELGYLPWPVFETMSSRGVFREPARNERLSHSPWIRPRRGDGSADNVPWRAPRLLVHARHGILCGDAAFGVGDLLRHVGRRKLLTNLAETT